MKTAALLLLLVIGCHYGYGLIASTYADPIAAGKALFYIARGVEGTVLFAIVAAGARHPAVFAVCLLGMYEESQTAICRAALPIASRPAAMPFDGLCGASSSWLGLGLAIFMAAWMADHLKKGRRP